MTCAACVGAVERALLKHPGVLQASVSLMSSSGKVAYDEHKTHPADLLALIEELGYGATLVTKASRTGGSDGGGGSGGSTDRATLEARTWLRQFLGSALFTLPIFLIAVVLPKTSMRQPLSTPVVPGLSVRVLLLGLLTTPVQFGFGLRFFKSALGALRHGSTNMDVLVALGSSAAYFYSLGFSTVSIVTAGRQAKDQEVRTRACMTRKAPLPCLHTTQGDAAPHGFLPTHSPAPLARVRAPVHLAPLLMRPLPPVL